jgi:diguanylate cyclase (GGDEF)-like protein
LDEKKWREAASFAEAFRVLVKEMNFDESQIIELALFVQLYVGEPLLEIATRFTGKTRLASEDRKFLERIAEEVKEGRRISEQAERASHRAERRAKEAAERALRNPTTLLWNIDGFHQRLSFHLRDRRTPAWALFYFDLRSFKFWNENFGHNAGSLALRAFADLLRGQIRAEDRADAANLHGDEFALLVPINRDKPEEVIEDAEIIARRVVGAIDSCDWWFAVAELAKGLDVVNPLNGTMRAADPICADMGVACWITSEEAHPTRETVKDVAEKYLGRADRSMKASKDVAHRLNFSQSSYQVVLFEWENDGFLRTSHPVRTNLPEIPSADE